jgi:hypothetical protein
MKRMILTTTAALAAMFTLAVDAQVAGVYPLITGNAGIPAQTTNEIIVNGNTIIYGNPGTASNLVQTVSEFDYVGLTFSMAGTAATISAPVGVRVFQSKDNGFTFEPNPSYTFSVTAAGAFTNTVVTNLDVHGSSHIAFQVFNNTGGYATNVLLEVNLKSPKYGAKAATQ